MKSLTQLSVLAAIMLAMNVHELKAQAVVAGAGGINLFGAGTAFTPTAGLNSPRFLWLPAKSALKAGTDSFTPSNSGLVADAMGQGSVAIGPNAFAKGAGSIALGDSSIALGMDAFATGTGWAQGDYSTAVSGGQAVGFGSFASGAGSAVGYISFAAGEGTIARAKYGVALGGNNVGVKKGAGGNPDPNITSPDDPVFEIGVGTGAGATPTANAFTVFRDGTVRLVKAGGGISMGQFQ